MCSSVLCYITVLLCCAIGVVHVWNDDIMCRVLLLCSIVHVGELT